MNARDVIAALVLLLVTDVAAQAPQWTASLPLASPLADASSDWPTYSGSFRSERYSPLAQIGTRNVADLRAAWIYQCGSGFVEATPIAANGLIYLTCPPATVVALSPQSGRPLWKWTRTLPQDVIT